MGKKKRKRVETGLEVGLLRQSFRLDEGHGPGLCVVKITLALSYMICILNKRLSAIQTPS